MNNHDTEDPATIVPTRRLNFSGKAAEASKAAAETSMEGHRPGSDDMTLEALQLQRDEVDRKILEKRDAETLAIINEIVEVVNTYHIPVDELVDALGGLKIKRKGVKAVRKYLDPVSGATWSGRGKEPVWIRGKDRKLFQIT